MLKRYLVTFGRILAGFLVIHGILFTLLQAYLLGLPLLLVGVGILWATASPAFSTPFKGSWPASTRSSFKSVKSPFSVYLSGRYSAGDCYFEPNDQNPRSPQFRSMSEQSGDDARDYNRT